jgi:hypothetical protein
LDQEIDSCQINMTMYKNQVHETLLFKRFEKLPVGMDEITEAEGKQLQAIVLDIADLVGPRMEAVGKTFRQYTDHSLTHLCNIANIIHKFLPESKMTKKANTGLNALELTILWAGILLHDVGMFVTEDEKEADLKSEAFRRFRQRSKDRVEAADRARMAGQPRRSQEIEEALIAEFYRRGHARRSNDFVTKHLSNRFLFRDVDLAKVMGKIAESHNWRVFQRDGGLSNDPYVEQLEVEELFGSIPVNLQYIACCLRMGDIMDFDRSRTPLVIFENMDFTEEVSRSEWNKHRSITGWKVSPAELVWKAECERPEYYIAVQEFLGWVDEELDSFSLIVDGFKEPVARRYPMPLPHRVKRNKVGMKNPNHITGAFKYQLEFGEIMQLLMDKSLYPDPALFLRELLQNSLDACRYQKALAIKEGMAEKYIPRIDVWDYSDDPEDPRIVFCDNGYGMDMRTIEQYFLRVGKSYYRSPDFAMERELLAEQGIFLDSCSRFGIGFLSCFLAGDKIEVETYRLGAADPLKVHITGPSRYFLLEKRESKQHATSFLSPTDRLKDGPPNYPGTKVTVHLKPGWRDGFEATNSGVVYDTIHTYAVATEFPITVYLNGGQSAMEIKGDDFSKTRFTFEHVENTEEPSHHPLQDLLTSIEIPLPEGDDSMKFGGHLRVPMFKDQTKFGARHRKGMSLSLNWGSLHDLPYLEVSFTNDLLGCLDCFFQFFRRITSRTIQNLHGISVWRQTPILTPEFISTWTRLNEDQKLLFKKTVLSMAQPKEKEAFDLTLFLNAVFDNDEAKIVQLLVFNSNVKKRVMDFELRGYTMALHGILVPIGVFNWNPIDGKAASFSILPAEIEGALNVSGTHAPLPSASRLYIPPDSTQGMMNKVNAAILKWAIEGLSVHKGDKEWEGFFSRIYRFCLHCSIEVVLSQMKDLVSIIKLQHYPAGRQVNRRTEPDAFDIIGATEGSALPLIRGMLEKWELNEDLLSPVEIASQIRLYEKEIRGPMPSKGEYDHVVKQIPIGDIDDSTSPDPVLRSLLLDLLIYSAEHEGPVHLEKDSSNQQKCTVQDALMRHKGVLPVSNQVNSPSPRIMACYEDLRIFQEAPLTTDENGQQYRDLREWVKKYLPSMKIETDR